MKAADAKKPQFNAAWWKKAKAKPADPKGILEKGLKEYEVSSAYWLSKMKNSLSGHTDTVRTDLLEIKKAATAEKGNKNLGTFQKETIEALNNYIKACDLAVKNIDTFEAAPLMTGAIEMLVKSAPQFKEYCKKNYQEENFNFITLMFKNAHKRFVYDDFVKPGAKFEANLAASTVKLFVAIEDKIKKGTLPDDDKTWKTAPWDKAEKEINALLRTDVLPRFRNYTLYTMLESKLP